ncbi:MAG: hypothetical protein Kow0029_15780 [Candidatus Rifleibacteriota bacterium]
MQEKIDRIRSMLASAEIDQRRQAIVYIARNNLEVLIPELTELAGCDSEQELRVLARKALEKLKAASVQKPDDIEQKYAAIHFEELLRSEDVYARFAGLKKALRLQSDVARLCLLASLEKETVPQLKASFIIAVSRFGNNDDVEFLAKFLRDPDSRVRANAVEALANLGGETANRYIIAMMADDDNRVKANVVKALKGIGGPNLLELLRKMAQDERVWMRASAVFAFTKIKSPQSLVMLGQIAASDTDASIREKALIALEAEKADGNPAAAVILQKLSQQAQAGNKKVGEDIESQILSERESDLASLLKNEDACKRYLAISQIEDDFDKYAEDFIHAFQKETDPFLLSMMLSIIKIKKTPAAINRCIQLLKHEDDRVRANAVEAAASVEIASSADYIYPLLQDTNSRVAANAVMALGSIGRVDILQEVKKLLNKGREAFKQSALYVISFQRDQSYVPLLEKLLEDPNPRVRDKAYDILRLFVKDKVNGSFRLLNEVEQRISLEKSREHFFENALDQMFGSLVQMIKSEQGEDAENEFVFERTPEAERHAFLLLAEKCIENGIVDAYTKDNLLKMDGEIKRLEKLLADISPATPNDDSLEESARKMSEIQLLRLELDSLKNRREAMMTSFALDVFEKRSSLDAKTKALLRVELARAEGSICSHIPSGKFSMLPAFESPVGEIFDVAMRIYQKHVWSFSGETALVFFKWFLIILIAAFFFGIFKGLGPGIALVYLLLAGPYFAFKSLELFAEWKTLVACMVDDYIHGRNVSRAERKKKVEKLYSHVFSSSLRKYFYLLAWFVMALLISGVLFGGSEAFGKVPFVSALGKLAGALIFIFVMASVYFKFMLIEPICVFDPKEDPFAKAENIYKENRIKITTLIIFASFIMALVPGTSLEILAFLMPVLPGKSGAYITNGLAMISEICLFPIVYASVVIYVLMYFRLITQKKSK